MKKFFGKKNVLVAFAVAAVIFLGGLIAMLASPVFYAGAYKGEMEISEDYKSEISYSFKFGNKIKAKGKATIAGKVEEESTELWYYKRGDLVIILDAVEEMTKEEFETRVEAYDKLTDEQLEAVASKINFKELKMGAEGIEFTFENKLSVAFVVIDAVLLALALAGTGLAVFYSKNGKKSKA